MTDVMQRCVPISNGALEPDLRVNYEFGLVLGVDEFEQEDRYFRERDERAARALHGYGTAVGLNVTAAIPVTAPEDVEVRVEPGIAVDQHGRPVVIPTAQCARVGAWLATQEEAAAAESQPSPLAAHLRPSGDLTLYVVAEYAECLDALVPLPGNPCGTDDDVMAPSRIRDSWSLGFRWEPPAMPHWDGVRELADLLAPIELADGSPLESDEAVLAEHIRALAPGAPPPLTPLPLSPVLPRLEARAALDRLLTIWVTEVRSALAPDLVHPTGEAAVLLTAITVVPAAPFDPDAPVIDAFALPDDEGRPYLAPTQLIQELVALGGGVATILAGSPVEVPTLPPPAPPLELGSLSELGTGGGRRLIFWSHLPALVRLSPTVDVSRDGGAPVAFAAVERSIPGSFELQAGGGELADGELLEVRFDLTRLRARDVVLGVDVPLTQWLTASGLDVVGRVRDEVRLHHTVNPTPPEPVPDPDPVPTPIPPVRQLLTATPVLVDRELPGIELWFHIDKSVADDQERIERIDPDAVKVLAEVETRTTSPVEIPFEVSSPQHNVFQLTLDQTVWKRRGQGSPYLRVVVQLPGVSVSNAGTDLASYATDLGIAWADAQEEGRVLASWVRMTVGV